jgi:adenine-specific DNA-methyltransferase
MSLANNPLLQLTGRQQHLWNEFEAFFPTERDLASAALALDAETVGPLSVQETALARAAQKATPLSNVKIAALRDLIRAGFDPLGEAFCALRSPADRRESGATYTPGPIVRAMIEWAAEQKVPGRIVDPGTGSARFLMQAGEAFPAATLIAVDIDPLATLLARANLAVRLTFHTAPHSACATVKTGCLGRRPPWPLRIAPVSSGSYRQRRALS